MKTELEKLQEKPREERTPIEQCIVDATTFEEAEHDGEIELMEKAANDLAAMEVRANGNIFSISISDKPQTLHVELVAATQMEFDISFARKDFSQVILDICRVAPAMMSYDSDLMEAFDDAFRTHPKQIDKTQIAIFLKTYRGAMSNIDIDFLEED